MLRQALTRPRNWHYWIPTLSVLLAAVLVVASIAAVYVNLYHIQDSFVWVQHTDDVLLEAANLDRDLVEAEAAGRAYVMTQDAEFLGDFIRLRNAVRRHGDALAVLTSDNPQQQDRLVRLEPLLDERLSQMDQAVALGPLQFPDTLLRLRRATAKRLRTEIRNLLSDFRQTELALLFQRQRRAEQALFQSIALAIATLVLALTSAMAIVWLFQHRNATQRERELTTDLIHFSRLNLMGQMTSMWGHELNQPLTACGNYLKGMLRIAQSEQAKNGVLANAVAQSLAQLDRAQAIIQRLKDFIRTGEPTASPEMVSQLIDEAVILLGMRSEGLTISTQVEEELPQVLVDKIQIEQVLINLMRNAVEAMEGSNPRSLSVTAKRQGDAVLISVSDTGPGISKAVSDRLFQSFNTTKSNGMGVGLSICRTLIVANGGQIWAEANPEGGAKFCFALPIRPPPADLAGSEAETGNHAPDGAGGASSGATALSPAANRG